MKLESKGNPKTIFFSHGKIYLTTEWFLRDFVFFLQFFCSFFLFCFLGKRDNSIGSQDSDMVYKLMVGVISRAVDCGNGTKTGIFNNQQLWLGCVASGLLTQGLIGLPF
jgi:hypothetical protein